MNDFGNHLTPRQTETLGLVVQGLTNDQIAHRMHIAPSTVKAQLTDAFRRLGVQNRTEAAIAFVRLGTHPAVAG
jgi:DNA-binding NarL/FixJ family response regulator